MLNKIPVIGWALTLAASVSLSVPFWICWSACGLGETYFAFLPVQWRSIPFWHCVGLFLIVGILKGMMMMPTLVSSSSSTEDAD